MVTISEGALPGRPGRRVRRGWTTPTAIASWAASANSPARRSETDRRGHHLPAGLPLMRSGAPDARSQWSASTIPTWRSPCSPAASAGAWSPCARHHTTSHEHRHQRPQARDVSELARCRRIPAQRCATFSASPCSSTKKDALRRDGQTGAGNVCTFGAGPLPTQRARSFIFSNRKGQNDLRIHAMNCARTQRIRQSSGDKVEVVDRRQAPGRWHRPAGSLRHLRHRVSRPTPAG